MNNTNLYLVRHGETVWNFEQRCQGQIDIPLNETGVVQAKKLGNYLRDVSIDAVYASDLSRARETAENVARPHCLKVQTLSELRERSYGEWEGLTFEEISERYPDHERVRREGGRYGVESFKDFQERIVHILTELVHRHGGETVLAVSHGGSINAFLHWVSEGSIGTGLTKIKNTSVTKVNYDHEGLWKVREVNVTEHLHKDQSRTV